MNKIQFYNTLTRKKEEFKPIKTGEVGLYTCGPTVYNYAHIGNLRTYIFEDILKRVLMYNGYKVKHIMNITDVGHLTGDQDMGEDKIESVFNIVLQCRHCGKSTRTPFLVTKKAFKTGTWTNISIKCEHCGGENIMSKNDTFNNLKIKKFKRTAWDVAKKYEEAFKEDIKKLNILPPDKYTRATEYIDEQINLIRTLEEKGYTYITSDGVYFDTAKFPEYNKLSHLKLEDLQEGARVEKNEEKKNPTDFAVWKFSPDPSAGGEKRQMEWESPWGVGFPGWHLECSAMSMAELGDQLDIHCGGIDHINVHHTNEIAQSEAATGKQFFNVWMHGAFLNIAGGKKMAKSDDNFLTLDKVFYDDGYPSLTYRYAALKTHYRKPMEWVESGDGDKHDVHNELLKLYKQIRLLYQDTSVNGKGKEVESVLEEQGVKIIKEYKENFLGAVNNDLNTPQALAVLYEVLKSSYSADEKLLTVLDFDKVLGLNLKDRMMAILKDEVPDDVEKLKREREKARAEKNFAESDRLRDEIEALGYSVEDSKEGMRIIKK